jgi:hypothetical protein
MRLVAACILITTLSACGLSAAPPSGGIRGTVTAGPTCPVERQGSPCPPAPWTGTVRATGSDGSTFEATTDGRGAYTLQLPDGTYAITPVLEGAGPPTASPVSVTISGGAMQPLDLQVDTGIR